MRHHSQFPWWFAALVYPIVVVDDAITKVKTTIKKTLKKEKE